MPEISDAFKKDLAVANFNSGFIQMAGSHANADESEGVVTVFLPPEFEKREIVIESLSDIGITNKHVAAPGEAIGSFIDTFKELTKGGDFGGFTDVDGMDLHDGIAAYDIRYGKEGENIPALVLSNEGVKLLIEAGVQHPVLDTAARHGGIELSPAHRRQVKKS